MQVNGEMITEEEVVELLPQIYDLCLPENNDIPATFFEITTALAFLFFAKRGVDVVVLETGTFFFHFFFGNTNMGRKKYKIVEHMGTEWYSSFAIPQQL
jgi:hypothetical protein